MAVCNFIAPNGEKSILAQALEQKYGPDVAARVWNIVAMNREEYTEKSVSLINSDNSINHAELEKQTISVINGTAFINTLSQEEERGRIAGGRRNVEASLLLRANETTGTGKRGTSEDQESILTKYATENGLWLPAPTQESFVHEGDEAKVYASPNAGYVRKVIDYKKHSRLPIDFLDNRISLHNYISPDTAYTLIGFTYTENFAGKPTFAFVVDQPHVSGKYIDLERDKQQIEDAGFLVTTQNFKPVLYNRDYVIKDQHERNILVGSNGTLHFIDTVPKLNTVTENLGGNREYGDGSLIGTTTLDINGEPVLLNVEQRNSEPLNKLAQIKSKYGNIQAKTETYSVHRSTIITRGAAASWQGEGILFGDFKGRKSPDRSNPVPDGQRHQPSTVDDVPVVLATNQDGSHIGELFTEDVGGKPIQEIANDQRGNIENMSLLATLYGGYLLSEASHTGLSRVFARLRRDFGVGVILNTNLNIGNAIAYDVRTKNIVISAGRFLELITNKDSGFIGQEHKLMDIVPKALEEELIHAVAINQLTEDETEGIWQEMSDEAIGSVKTLYGFKTTVGNEANIVQEYIRIVTQSILNGEETRVTSRNLLNRILDKLLKALDYIMEELYSQPKPHIWSAITKIEEYINEHGTATDPKESAGGMVSLGTDTNGEPTLSHLEISHPQLFEKHNVLVPKRDEAVPAVRVAPIATVVDKYKKTVYPVIGMMYDKKEGKRSDKAEIVAVIKKMYQQALANPTTLYQPPYKYQNFKKVLTNGYTAVEFAWLIAEAGPMPTNVRFDASIQQAINGLPINYAKDYKLENQSTREAVNINGDTTQRQQNELFVPILNSNGEQVGNFSADKQLAAVNTVLKLVYMQINSDRTVTPYRALNKAMKKLIDFSEDYRLDAIDFEEEVPQVAYDLLEVVNSFSFDPKQGRSSIASLTLEALESYGVTVTNKDQVLRALEIDKNALLSGSQPSQNVQMDIDKEGLKETEKDDVEGTVEDENGTTGELGTTLQDYNDSVFEHDPIDTASWRMKLFFSTLVDVRWVKDESAEGGKKIEARKNYLNAPELASFDDVYRKVMGLLSDQDPTFENYMSILSRNAEDLPILNQVVNNLRAQDVSLQNEFVKVMSTSYAKYLMTTFNHIVTKDGRHIYVLNPFEANRASRIQQTIRDWQEAQKISPLMITVHGERVIDTERVNRNVVPRLELFNIMYSKIPLSFGTRTKQRLNEEADEIIRSIGLTPKEFRENLLFYAEHFFMQLMKLNGVDFNKDMTEDLFKHAGAHTNGTSLSAGNIGGLFRFNSTDGKPSGLISVLVWKLAGKLTDNDSMESMTPDSRRTLASVNNPFYTETTAMTILARIASKHTPLKTTDSHRTGEGKTVFDYILPSELLQKMNSLHLKDSEAFDQIFEAAREVNMTRYNFLLEHWRNSYGSRKKAEIWFNDSIKPTWARKGTTRQNMSDREQILDSISAFQNRNKSLAHYISLTHSDKTTTPIFHNFPRLRTGNLEVSREAQIALYKVFLTEYERVRDHQDVDFNHKQYNAGKHLFFQLPEFNVEYMKESVKNGTLINGKPMTQKDIDTLWNADGTIANNINDRAKKMIVGMINNFIRDLTDSTLKKWSDAGVISREDNRYAFDRSYTRGILKRLNYQFEGRNPKDQHWKDPKGNKLTEEQIFDTVTRIAAREYAINYFLVNTAMAQLVFGDPAQAVKAKSNQFTTEGTIVPGQVHAVIESTMIEYSKRLAKDIAPGQAFQWQKPTYQTVTLADVKTAEDYLNSKKLKEAYKEVDATDAVEVTTVREHLTVMFASGVISGSVFNDMMKIVDEGERSKDGFYEFTDPEHLAIVMEPMKPVYVGTRPNDRGIEFHDYIKSASYPLYPPLTMGFEIDHLRRAMENKGQEAGRVDRVNFASAKKMGQGKKPAKAFNPDGTFNHSVLTDGSWVAATQTLEREHFRIQQEVPYDEVKEAIKTITQMNRLIVESISEVTEPFRVQGFGDMNGQQLRKLKEDTRKELINRKREQFFRENGIVSTPTGIEIRDTSLILKRLEEEARSGNFTKNEIASLLYKTKENLDDPNVNIEEKLQIPLMFSTAAEKYESLMMSMIKDISQIKMPGKSYVQASSVGYVRRKDLRTMENLTEDQKSSIVFAEGFNANTPLRTMQIGEDGRVIPAQVLAPFNFIITDKNGNRVKADIKDYMIPGTNRLDSSKIPKELLQLVGARIPNQKHSSMLAIEIVGFVPDNMGDIMIVPSAITKQMGSDFDVDKLYTYKRPYKRMNGGFIVDDGTRPGTQEDWDKFIRPTTDQRMGKSGTPEDYEEETWRVAREFYGENPIPTHKTDNKLTEDQLKTQYFNLHWAVLTNPEMYDRVLAPLDKEDLADEAKLLAQKISGFHNFFDVGTQLADFQSGKYAKQMVAKTSLSVTFNAFIQDKKLRLGHRQVELDSNGDPTGRILEVNDYITINGLKLSKLSGYGKSKYNGETRSKTDNFTTIQSGAVDNAKTRVLNNLNLTPNTYNAVVAMLMLETDSGESLDLRYATRMITQPVIKEFSKLMSSGNDSMSEKFQPDLKGSVIEQLRSRIISKHLQRAGVEESDEQKGKLLSEAENFVISPDSMLEEISKPTSEGQLAILNLFETLDEAGKRVAELQSLFNQETNGAGQNLLTAMDKNTKIGMLGVNTPFLGESSLYNNEGEITEQGNTFDATVSTAMEVVTKLFPYNRYSSVIERIKKETLKPTLSVDAQKDVVRAMRSFVYSGTSQLWGDPSAERFRLFHNTDQGKSLAQRVMGAQRTWGKSNYFLQRINPIIADMGIGPDSLDFKSAKTATYDDDRNVVSFMQLLQSDDREQRLLAEDLVRYTYLTGGQADLSSFITKVPTSYIVDSGLADELREAERDPGWYANSEGFFIQYIQHNPTSTVQIDGKMFGELPEGQEYPETFILPDAPGLVGTLMTTDEEGMPKLVDFVHFRAKSEGNKIILYMRRGTTFVRVDTLGNSAADEYNAKVNFGVRSIFQENRSLMDGFKTPTEAEKLDDKVGDLIKGAESSNHFLNWGMSSASGDMDTATKMLRNIEADEKVPTSLRTTAAVLLSTNNNTVDTSGYFEVTKQYPPFSVKFGRSEGAGGSYSALQNSITIDPNQESRAKAAETLLHEMVHHRNSVIMQLSGYGLSEEANKILAKQIREFREKNPETVAIVERLDVLRYEALQALIAKLGEERVQQIEQDLKENKVDTADHELVYALSNVHEFASYVMSSKSVAEFLNEVDNTRYGKSFMDRVWDLLEELLLSVAKTLGVAKLRDSGILKAAIINVMKLSSAQGTGPLDINQAIINNQSFSTSTEHEAKQYQRILQNNYNKVVKVRNTGLNHALDIRQNMAKVEDKSKEFAELLGIEGEVETPPEISRVVAQLKKQQENLRGVQARTGKDTIEDRAFRLEMENRRRQLGEQIGKLLTKSRIKDLVAIGTAQLDWVEKTLNKKNLRPQEVMVSFDTLDTWMDMVKTMYGTDEGVVTVDPALSSLVTRAEVIRGNLATHKARAAYIELAKTTFGVQLTEKHFRDITDINVMKREFLNLSRTQRGVVATMAGFGMRSAENATEDISRLGSQLDKLEKKIVAAGFKTRAQQAELYKSFMQENKEKTAWGIVRRYSPAWSAFVQKEFRSLQVGLQAADNLGKKQARVEKSKLFRRYRDNLNKAAEFIDVRIFFDPETGELLQGPKQNDERARLQKTLSSSEQIDEMISKAGALYKSYLSERKSRFFDLDNNTELTEEEVAAIPRSEAEMGMTDQEYEKVLEEKKKQLLTEKIKKRKFKWESWNSPRVFFDAQFDNNNDLGFGSDKYVVMAPRAARKSFYDSKYQKIHENTTVAEIYNEFISIRDRLLENLPEHIKEKLSDDFLPAMTDELINSMFGNLARFKPSAIRATMFKGITVSQYEKDNPHNSTEIPIKHIDLTNINNIGDDSREIAKRAQEVEQRSTDLPRIMDVFGRMVFHYEHMSKVIDAINIGETLLKDVNKARLSDPKAKPIPNILEGIKYWKEALVFRNSKKVEGVSEQALYSDKRSEHLRIEQEVKTLTERQIELMSKSVDDLMDQAEAKELQNISKRLNEIADSSRYLAASKGADRLISFTQLKALAYNPFAAVTNVTFALVSTFTYANGRMDYTSKDVWKAWKVMNHATKKFMMLGDKGDPIAQKIKNAMERGNFLSEVVSDEFGESNIRNRQGSGLKRAIRPNNWQYSGDYFTKGMLMVAMMMNKKVQVTENGVQKTISLWDATGTDGYWDEEKYGEKPEWSDQNTEKQMEWNKFKGRVKRVQLLIHGNQDRNAPIKGKASMFIRIFGQFRLSWLPEGIAARWLDEGDDIDPLLGRAVKGRYKTMADIGWLASGKLLIRQALSALPGSKIDAFRGVKYGKGPKVGQALSQVDIENMRKNLAGIAFTIGFLTAIMIVRYGLLPDDDEKKHRRKMGLPVNPPGVLFAMNMLTRNYQDLSMYSNTNVINTVMGSTAPVVSTLNDSWKLLNASVHLLSDDDKKYEKAMKALNRNIPGLNNYINKLDYMTTDDISNFGR